MALAGTAVVEIPADGSDEDGVLIAAANSRRISLSFRPGLAESIDVRPDGSTDFFPLRAGEGMMGVVAGNALYARSSAGATVYVWEETQ